MVVCRYFQQGFCRFSNNCRNEHIYSHQSNKYNYNASHSNTSSSSNTDQILNTILPEVGVTLKSGQWILSCYSPFKNKINFPGFSDFSPEEIRFNTYQAQAVGNVHDYIKRVSNAEEVYKRNYRMFLNPSNALIRTIQNVYDGKNVQIPFDTNITESYLTIHSTPTTSNNAFSSNNSSSNVFATQQNGNSFQNQNTASAASSLFALANANLQSPNGDQPFGSPAQPAHSVFGAPTTQQTPQNVFGSPSTEQTAQSIFGAASAQQSPQSVFGEVTQPTSQSIFGVAAQQPQQNVFNTAATQQPTQSVFGSPSQNVFESAQPNAQAIFGAAQPNAQNVFGAAQPNAQNIFGDAQSNAQNVFGAAQPPAQNVFGAAQPNAQNVFGAASNNNNVFGSPPVYKNPFEMPQQQQENNPFLSNAFFNSTQSNDPKELEGIVYSKVELLSESDIQAFECGEFKKGGIPEIAPPIHLCK